MTIQPKWQKPLLLAILTVLLLSLVLHPTTAYDAAVRGLTLWWKVIAPALLPFFIISELLLDLGLTAYAGPLLRPLMRPLFSLPGNAAIGVALGFCSGFPTGASVAAGLRRRGEITREQGERLTAFTNNAGPLYVTVSVAVGLLHCPAAGLLLAISHYGSNLIIGTVLGLLSRKQNTAENRISSENLPSPGVFPGRALKQAAERSAGNILIIGCYMVFFSVAASLPEGLLDSPNPLFRALLLGALEMSLGMDALAKSGLPLRDMIPWSAAMLSFGGISVITQVIAMQTDTDLRPTVYLCCRILQAMLSFIIAKLLCRSFLLPTAILPLTEITVNIPLFSWSVSLLLIIPVIISYFASGVSRL